MATGKGLPRSLKSGKLSFTQLTDKPTTYPPTIGTTGTTAMAGNKAPTATQRGGVLQQAAIADVSAAPTQQNFNAVLAALRAAGLLASS